jgi:hypothetical protein
LGCIEEHDGCSVLSQSSMLIVSRRKSRRCWVFCLDLFFINSIFNDVVDQGARLRFHELFPLTLAVKSSVYSSGIIIFLVLLAFSSESNLFCTYLTSNNSAVPNLLMRLNNVHLACPSVRMPCPSWILKSRGTRLLFEKLGNSHPRTVGSCAKVLRLAREEKNPLMHSLFQLS